MRRKITSMFLILSLILGYAQNFNIAYGDTTLENLTPIQVDEASDKRYVSLSEEDHTKIKVGETIPIFALVVDKDKKEDGYYDDIEFIASYNQYTWTSSDETIAIVETESEDEQAIGNVTGIATGITTLKVASNDCPNCEPKEIVVEVVEEPKPEATEEPTKNPDGEGENPSKPVAQKEVENLSIEVDQQIDQIVAGRNIKLNVIAKDKEDGVVEKPTIRWESTPENIGSIDSDNIFHSQSAGDITIKAFVDRTDGTIVTSNEVSLRVVRDETREEKIDAAISALLSRYKNPTFYGPDGLSGKYTDSVALSLRFVGMTPEEINATKNIFSTEADAYSTYNVARNMMTLIAANQDPQKEATKIVGEAYNFYEEVDEEAPEKIISSIIALDMAGVGYDEEQAINALLGLLKDGDKGSKYIELYDELNGELTAKAMIALSEHKNIAGVASAIEGMKKALKNLQSSSGLIMQASFDGNEESCSVTSRLIQALIALGEDPTEEFWEVEDQYKNKNTLVDGMLSCQDGDQFKETLQGGKNDVTTDITLGALADLKNQSSMYHEIKYVQPKEASEITLENVKDDVIIEGDVVNLTAAIYDKNHTIIRTEKILWESSDPETATVDGGIVKTLKSGTVTITARLENNQGINKTILLTIESGASDESLKAKLEKEVDFLKNHYEAHNQYEFLAAPAAAAVGIEPAKIQNRLQTPSSYTNAYHYSKLIISALGASLNPRNIEIEKETKNAVDILRASQVKVGKNKGQFVINGHSDIDSIQTLSYAIIALDMADAKYDQKAAIAALLNLLKAPDVAIKLGANEVRTKAGALIALAKHKDQEEVAKQIDEIIVFLKEKQNDDGGFSSKMGTNCPVTTSTVVQALVANGINPLYSKEWMKNKQTVLDSMLKNKYENPKDIAMSGFSKFEGGSRDFEATYAVFAAVAEMKLGVSLFEKFATSYDDSKMTQEPSTIKIKPLQNSTILVGQKLDLEANVFDKKSNLIDAADVIWSLDDETIARVNNGVLDGIKPGKTKVTATVKETNIHDTIEITVEDSGIKSIHILSQKDKIRVSDPLLLEAEGINKVGDKITSVDVVWTLEDNNTGKIYQEDGRFYLQASKPGIIVLNAVIENNPSITAKKTIEVIQKQSVRAKVRIEAHNKTIVPETLLEVDNFDMGAYGDNSAILKEHPTAMNGIIKAMEAAKINCNDKANFDAGMDLSRLIALAGVKEFDLGPNSGWMYYINDRYVPDYLINTNLKDGDTLCVFYVEDYEKTMYAYFDKNEVVIKPNEKIELNLKSVLKGGTEVPVTNATLEYRKIGDAEFKKLPNQVTDKDGKAVMSFQEEGEYILTASRTNGDLISRPYCKVKVTNDLQNNQFDVKVLDSKSLKTGEEARLKLAIKNQAQDAAPMTLRVVLCDANNKILKTSSLQKSLQSGETILASPGFAIPEEGDYSLKIFVSEKPVVDLFKPSLVITIN